MFDNIVEWKPINGWPYDVSSSGMIRNSKTKKILNPTRQKQKMKYLVVTLYKGSRETKTQFYLHSLICSAFHGICPENYECRHIDGNILNCSAYNLSWGTAKQNQNDRLLHGTDTCGERNGRSVLSNNDVIFIRNTVLKARELGRNHSYGLIKDLAENYGVKRDAILRAVSGKTWSTL